MKLRPSINPFDDQISKISLSVSGGRARTSNVTSSNGLSSSVIAPSRERLRPARFTAASGEIDQARAAAGGEGEARSLGRRRRAVRAHFVGIRAGRAGAPSKKLPANCCSPATRRRQSRSSRRPTKTRGGEVYASTRWSRSAVEIAAAKSRDRELEAMLAQFLRVGRLELGPGPAAARREIGTRQPPDASQQSQENRRARGFGPRLDFEDAAARERGRELGAFDGGERAMRHGGIDVLGAARLGRRERAADYAEAGVVHGVGGDDWRAQCGAQAMVARSIASRRR